MYNSIYLVERPFVSVEIQIYPFKRKYIRLNAIKPNKTYLNSKKKQLLHL